MDALFTNLKDEITSVIDLGVKVDQSVSLGMASRTEEQLKETENTANVWLNLLLNNIHKKLLSIFNKFVVWICLISGRSTENH